MIVLWGDHGWKLGEYGSWCKHTNFEVASRTPLLVAAPGVEGGRVSQRLVEYIDVYPTLCELAGVEIPRDRLMLDGRSFVPQLLGKQGDPREWIYCWYSRGGADKKAKVFARTHRYKLYRNGDFFDIEQDVLEKNLLAAEALNTEQGQVKATLQNVIDEYERIRGQ